MYAAHTYVVLPVRTLFKVVNDKLVPTTPFAKYFDVDAARVGRFRVWGAPCVITLPPRRSLVAGIAKILNNQNNP